MNNSKECPSFEGCNASLCPLEEGSLKNGIWYPEEEICKNQKVNKLDWIKTQRKLSRKAMPDFYFNYQMLSHKFRVCKRIKGLNPFKPNDPQQTRWFKIHPKLKKQILTPEHLERLKKGRNDQKGTAQEQGNLKNMPASKVFTK